GLRRDVEKREGGDQRSSFRAQQVQGVCGRPRAPGRSFAMRIGKTLSQALLAGSGCVALLMPAHVAWSTPLAAPTLTTLAVPDGSVTLSGSVIPTLNDTATLAG